MRNGWFCGLLMAVALLLIFPGLTQGRATPAASNGAVTALGSLASLGSVAYAVSAKGEVVAGTSFSSIPNNALREFRWTQAGGMQDLDPNGNDNQEGNAYGISADGNVIVGELFHYPECNPNCGFWWTSAGGFELLYPPNGWYGPVATGVSKDGGVLVGSASQAYTGTPHAWQWTGLNGFVDLGTLPNSCCGAGAAAVSEDGKVVVGYSYDSAMQMHPIRWTGAGAMQDLGWLPGGWWGTAAGASTNGSVIVGGSYTTTNCPAGASYCTAPFRWTKATGLVQIPILAGKYGAIATGVSADGKTVVGYASTNCCDWEAWRWTAATGTQSINDWLADVGVDATAFYFYSAYAVTANGNGVVGQLNGSSGDAYLALVKANKTATPTYSPKPGTYHSPQSVTISDMAPSASIYYTTDGSTPTKNSTPYTGPILVSVTTTIKSIAIAPGYPKSAVATRVYKIK